MKSALVIFALFASSLTQARTIYADHYTEINKRYIFNQPSDCVTEYITLLSETERLSKACHADKPLRLSWMIQDYPNLRENPRRVQYWEGSVAKEVATDRKYLRELVDNCHGRIISKSTLVETTKQTETFDIRNPNLDTSISESFMLVPMTSAEAASEVIEATHRCEAN